ncbi:nucleotidyltransferase family protein [Paenibacillus sp.]|jgi:xanthine dehydrogenase accessory protein pucB|uniref:nucleotidyltransferase family protein n=1 Tax=Paenibacillus sp. TaxID=58172 RepID=UPI00282BDE10|nr:nucleotidyltransferase family protein [Paenibacillus sp.]MDR0269941.1 nucleotidyltransferase family protein [Paenibacillus sp.]
MRKNNIIGIYLAAGQSTRMESNKLRLPLGPMRLGNYALAAALDSGLDHILIVSGDAEADWVDHSFYENPIHRRWSVINCPDAHLGQAYSLRSGIRAAMLMETAAVMILLADQPLITTEMINTLLERYQTDQVQKHFYYAAAGLNGLARPPVIFHEQMFPELLQLQGDTGARQLIRKDSPGICVDFKNPDLFMDVDTEEDYTFLLRKMFFSKS